MFLCKNFRGFYKNVLFFSSLRNLRSEKQHMEEAKLARITDLEKSSLPVRILDT